MENIECKVCTGITVENEVCRNCGAGKKDEDITTDEDISTKE